ncbi:TraB/VirB10 family protein [Photorhabdus aegyptia]|uniref:Bacterial conjugation TrbI-like protein n=1 Tax=Photorhabdus aegyptia TaxID=2805098 RepID=A0A022PG38_9GAMM|nr:TraB/VirB10 family protein [Photorhabdus aegyptia]EYU15107.1 Bacterial conjugation TrbI-like protein [Photorhabdus aegyptia]
MINVSEEWASMSAKKKRLLVWGGGLAVLIPILLLLMPDVPAPRSRVNDDKVISSILTDSDTTGVSQNAIAARLRALDESMTKNNRQIEILVKNSNMDEIKKRLTTLETQQRNASQEQAALKKRLENSTNAIPYPVSSTSQTKRRADYNVPKSNDVGVAIKSIRPNDYNTLQRVYQAVEQPEPADFGADTVRNKGKTGKPVEPVVPDIVTVQEDTKEEAETNPGKNPEFQTYLPATSIISTVLISGMDAPTERNARKDPYPALARVKKDAILPNRFRADIRECGLLAAGFGDLSSERAYFRTEVITCIRNDGTVFEAPIDAYAVGEDGKSGVRGRLVTKQGQYLAKALTAGFLQAASQLFSVQNIPTINVRRDGDDKNGSPYQQVMSNTAFQGAAIAGVGGALDRLADFYMQMAGDLFPVIEIDPGRSVDFIVQKGVTLNFTRIAPKSINSTENNK